MMLRVAFELMSFAAASKPSGARAASMSAVRPSASLASGSAPAIVAPPWSESPKMFESPQCSHVVGAVGSRRHVNNIHELPVVWSPGLALYC